MRSGRGGAGGASDGDHRGGIHGAPVFHARAVGLPGPLLPAGRGGAQEPSGAAGRLCPVGGHGGRFGSGQGVCEPAGHDAQALADAGASGEGLLPHLHGAGHAVHQRRHVPAHRVFPGENGHGAGEVADAVRLPPQHHQRISGFYAVRPVSGAA